MKGAGIEKGTRVAREVDLPQGMCDARIKARW